jgi:ribosome recycling factor
VGLRGVQNWLSFALPATPFIFATPKRPQQSGGPFPTVSHSPTFMANTIPEVLSELEAHIKKSLDFFIEELNRIRAGRANPNMFDPVRIDYYGTPTAIAQCATILVADARTLTIQPFEPKHIGPIERAIAEANLGVNPQNDGRIIRIVLPQLTEDRRRDLVKQASGVAEENRVKVRNHRRDANELLKKLQKNGEPEDAVKAAEAEVQKITDKYIAKIDATFKAKEEEIMKV